MEFHNISYAMIYFLSDKTFAINGVGDLIGWDATAYERLASGEVVMADAYFDCILQKVSCIMSFNVF